MTAAERAALETLLTQKQAQLDAANASYTTALSSGTESYRFDSGEGSQAAKYRSLKEIREAIDALEADIDDIQRRLSGKGIMRIGLRRYC